MGLELNHKNLLLWFAKHYTTQEGRAFNNGPGDQSSIPGRVIPKTIKNGTTCSTISIIRYVSRVKWSNQRKWVAPSSKHRCSSIWKESLRVTLDYSRTLYSTRLCIWSLLHLYVSTFIYYHHHRHQVGLISRSSVNLSLSRHTSLSSIGPVWSARMPSVST